MKSNVKFFVIAFLKAFGALVLASFPLSAIAPFAEIARGNATALISIGVFVFFDLFFYDFLFTRRQNRVIIDRTKPEDMASASRNYFREYTRKEAIVHVVWAIPLGMIPFLAWLSRGKVDYASVGTMVVAVLFPLISYFASKKRIDKEAKKILEVLEMRKHSEDYR